MNIIDDLISSLFHLLCCNRLVSVTLTSSKVQDMKAIYDTDVECCTNTLYKQLSHYACFILEFITFFNALLLLLIALCISYDYLVYSCLEAVFYCVSFIKAIGHISEKQV
jgi:hypothetical protein